jgi:hypothetical protein
MLTKLTACVAAAALVVPAVAAGGGNGAVQRATSLLRGKSFTRFVETGSIAVPSSYDQRLHLCSDGRFVYDTVSSITGASRVTGTWRVVAAAFRGTSGSARVRGVPDGGASITIVVATRGSRTTIDGGLVIVARSDLCR